jgi:hypothetical protein
VDAGSREENATSKPSPILFSTTEEPSMTDAQTTAEPARTPQDPEHEAAIAAMVSAYEGAYEALSKAWPALVAGYQGGGPHPLASAATILCKVQWDVTQAWIENEGKTKPEDLFSAVSSSCVENLMQALPDVYDMMTAEPGETLQ